MAALVFLQMAYWFWRTATFQYLIFAGLAVFFAALQLIALRRKKSAHHIAQANWLLIFALLLCILVITVFVHNSLLICVYFFAAIPPAVAVTGQLKQLPAVLFLTFVSAAVTILIDLTLPLAPWRLMAQGRAIWLYTGAGFLIYLTCLGLISYHRYRRRKRHKRLKINVATQYALVFTGISAMAIILVTGVMIHQIRNAQINQVGKSFQTIAENFAKLVGSHLEQQTQKLQLLTQQVPIFKNALLQANIQYENRSAAREQLIQKNRLWQSPQKDTRFMMRYLNNPTTNALSRFRGNNSFHNELMLVDRYGGLVASLGKKPDHLYFYNQKWWKITWNEGIGNSFIGDLAMDERAMVPKLRIAVNIIDHSTNDVIGMLSSIYLLKTLLEDIRRFKPDTVDQISLTDAWGRVIASTHAQIAEQLAWSQLDELSKPETTMDSGWVLGRDHMDHAVLIGFSTLSTAYNVISDPLHRLGWHIVVSGTRSNALMGVTQSTKLAMLVGLVAMALGVLGAIAAARVITRPIENLTATASAMIEGDLGNRAQLTGPEELVALSSGFNRLTDRLHNVIRNLKTQTEQLAKAKRGAEAATQLKGEFLANMSHEIRTPLNAILGFADILESSIEDDKQKRHAQTIKTSGADLLHLINDILDLSKIEAGRMEIQMSPVNLRTLFSDLQRIFSISAEEKKIQIEMTVAPELPKYMMIDRVRLRQVLFNLIGNAVKFTDQGKVGCFAKAEPACKDDTWNLTIEVRDTGIGIDHKVHTQIFETFQQHQSESGIPHEGTGLGLAISKNLIEMMGGRIDVEGQPGKGSLFAINIPRVIAVDEVTCPVADIDETPKETMVHFEPATILIADDLEVNRHLIIEALKPYPLEIDQAEHGKAAVAMATRKRFDLILMDIRMPGMDGYSALKNIRPHFNGAASCIIATTASGMKEDIAKIQQAGFDDYLIRPFDQEALVQLLTRYLPHEYATAQTPPSKPMRPMTASAIQAQPPWVCPSEAHDYLSITLRHRWEQVSRKQSIPEILSFANDVRSAGDQYHIDLLSQYGKELAEYAEGFDIHNVEKMLHIYDVILSCRIDDGSKET
jgi:two-component system sensor histidine kinase EvgS